MTTDPKILSGFYRGDQSMDVKGFNLTKILLIHGSGSHENVGSEFPKIPTNFEEKDIELVMSQASASRENTIKALEESGGDIVNAVISLIQEQEGEEEK